MKQPHIMFETEGHVAKIIMNRPEAKNAFSPEIITRAVYQAQRSDLRSHLDYISSQLALVSETRDHQEAARAFLEKRKPDFKGA